MTDVEILTQAFTKVKKNGYEGALPTYDENMGQWYVSDSDGGYFVPSIPEIIMSHEFAKAFWGKKEIEVFKEFGYEPGVDDDDPGDEYNIYEYPIEWQYRLQQMVLCEDRVGYLGRFL